MQHIALMDGPVTFEGAVSLERVSDAVRVWRLPWRDQALFEPPLIRRGHQPAGVRATLLSDTAHLCVEVEPVEGEQTWAWDLLVDGASHDRVVQPTTASTIRFAPLPPAKDGRTRRIEVYLPTQYVPVTVRSIAIDDGAAAQPWRDARRRWVVYGSSITHAREAAGPSEAWPAQVARRFDLHLTCLGYGGEEHLEPTVARMIRDLPADLISLCVGGNVWGASSLSARTFPAAVIGMVRTIREQHPHTPLAVCSFIWTRHDKGAAVNKVGLTMDDYRRFTAEAVDRLRAHGDAHVFYVSGKDIFGAEQAHLLLADGVHPGAQAQAWLTQAYSERVMARLLNG